MANKEQGRVSSMDNMYFYRTRNWDDPPPTCYVKPAFKPLYRPYVVCIFDICQPLEMEQLFEISVRFDKMPHLSSPVCCS